MIRFLDLRITDEREREELIDAFQSHLASGHLIINDEGDKLEQEIAEYQNRNYCVAVNSGTDALTIGLRLLNLEPGTSVITTPFSWIASSTCVLLAGLKPLFVDIDNNLQISISAINDQLTNRSDEIGAVLVPHLHGNVSNLSALRKLRDLHNVKIIEDCAQSFGSKDSNGELAGTVGDIAAFSFNPMKILGALGDAGAIVFDDAHLVERARKLRHSGVLGTFGIASEVASNCRMDALQASILSVRLRYLNNKLERRREIAKLYDAGLPKLITPVIDNISFSNFYCYQIICNERDDLAKYLKEKGVETRIRHNFLIPDHPIFEKLGGRFPNAQKLVSKTLCLPMHHLLSDEDVRFTIETVHDFYKR